MAEEELIALFADNPLIYDQTLKGYHDPYLKSTQFISIVLLNLSKVNNM